MIMSLHWLPVGEKDESTAPGGGEYGASATAPGPAMLLNRVNVFYGSVKEL